MGDQEQPDLWGGETSPPSWASEPVTKTELTTEPIALWMQRATKGVGPAQMTSKRFTGPNGFMIGVYGKGPEGATCGTCAHLFRLRHHDYTYLKCRKHGVTNGPGTDHRKKWSACKLYVEREGAIEER